MHSWNLEIIQYLVTANVCDRVALMTKAMNEASWEYSIRHLCVANNLKEFTLVFIYWLKQLCDIVQLLNILSDFVPKGLIPRTSTQDFVK